MNKAQQAQSPDALLSKFKKDKYKFDLGFAINTNRETFFKEDLYPVKNYI